jgi:hypothetical protein
MEKDWAVEVLDAKEAAEYLESDWGPIEISVHGTSIIWTDLDRLPIREAGLEKACWIAPAPADAPPWAALPPFFGGRKARGSLWIARFIGESPNGIAQRPKPLNPFKYPTSPRRDYPTDV